MLEHALTLSELRHLIMLTERDRRQALKEHEKSNFVPAQGRRDANLSRVERASELIGKLKGIMNQID
tara:strand:+ start:1146 stop:1346 length:201 start_codon:yes stop_codon:yes gene_type:complete